MDYKEILKEVKNHLNTLKKNVFKNKPIITTSENVLTLLSLQFSMFKGDFDKLSLDVKIKTFILFFSRYINRKEVSERFEDCDSSISLISGKKMKTFLNG
jgi:hypothetical protein